MQLRETHRLDTDSSPVELWCNRCGANVAHSFIATTDNVVERRLDGRYRDAGRVVGLVAECGAGHRSAII